MSSIIPNSNLEKIIKEQIELRHCVAPYLGIKINLYKDYEVLALAEALDMLAHEKIFEISPVESIMVGDSYFTTHLGKMTTQLSTKKEQREGLDTMVSLIKEVKNAISLYFTKNSKPYLIGDMPDGSLNSLNTAIHSVTRLQDAGCDIVKIEVNSNESLEIVEKLCDDGFKVMAHIGYTPQKGELRRYGSSFAEALSIYALVRKLKNCGVIAIVLEMVDEIINQCLCKNAKDMQIYSIFSGKSVYGGQSLNIWDAFFKPGFNNKYFPPTAQHDRSCYPQAYTKDAIKTKIYELIKITLHGNFPISPPSRLSEKDRAILKSIDPWNGELNFYKNLISEGIES